METSKRACAEPSKIAARFTYMLHAAVGPERHGDFNALAIAHHHHCLVMAVTLCHSVTTIIMVVVITL